MAEQDRDQRTHDATPQRIQRALQEGQVGVSSELLAAIAFSVGVLFFLLAGYWFFASIAKVFQSRPMAFEFTIADSNMLKSVITNDVINVGIALLGLLVPVFLITALAGGLQTNFNLSFKPLEFKLDKLSVKKGFERIFSMRSVMRGLMAILKASAILVIVILIAQSQFETIVLSGAVSFHYLVIQLCRILLYLGVAAAGIITLIGIGDLLFQKWKHLQDLRMSFRDIRDEQKESEGDPAIRARLKHLQKEMRKQQTIRDVAGADFVVTNPTHFAVALKYDTTKMIAPTVIAKGTEALAKKIIEVAKENGVPVVERKPVARFLYFKVKIGQSIPQEIYGAVAEILNFIHRMKLDRRRRKSA